MNVVIHKIKFYDFFCNNKLEFEEQTKYKIIEYLYIINELDQIAVQNRSTCSILFEHSLHSLNCKRARKAILN